jgi:hypothetical protein
MGGKKLTTKTVKRKGAPTHPGSRRAAQLERCHLRETRLAQGKGVAGRKRGAKGQCRADERRRSGACCSMALWRGALLHEADAGLVHCEARSWPAGKFCCRARTRAHCKLAGRGAKIAAVLQR